MSITLPDPLPEPSGISAELAVNRKNTRAFLLADPVNLVLQHREKQPTPAGGYKLGAPVPRQEQVFRMIPQSDVMPSVQTPDGITLTPTYVLLGEHDVVMDRWDQFEFNGVKFVIVSPIRPDYTLENVYERKADVARL